MDWTRHSNRYKRLRGIAKMLALKEDVLTAVYRETVAAVLVMKDGNPVMANPRATKPKNKWAREGKRVRTIHAVWQGACAKRLRKDMKRDGWGGTRARLQKLIDGVRP